MSSSSNDNTPIGTVSRTQNTGCAALISLLFFGVGLALFVVMTLLPLARWIGAQSWTPTPCRIVASKIVTVEDSDGDTYKTDIAYSYNWNGQTYFGDDFSHAGESSGSYNASLRRTQTYPTGVATTCYVNPANPNQAVLWNGFDTDFLFGGIGLPFMVVPLLMMFGMRRGQRTDARWAPQTVVHQATPGGAVVLKPQGGGIWGRFFAMWIFAGIWNGFIGFAISQMVRDGGFVWFFLLFMIPFVIIGILILLGALSATGGLFNARPHLVLSSAELRPGEAVSVSLELRGGWTRPTKLVVTLEGREEATYTVGTSTSTARETFHFEPLLETTAAAPVSAFSLQVPDNTMHSLEASNNKIVWEVALRGSIRLWPDLAETWKITVLPALTPVQETHS